MLGAQRRAPVDPDLRQRHVERGTGGYHYGWFHFALRDRLRQANGGNADNMVMWRSVSGNRGRELFDNWMAAYKSDTSSDPQRVEVLRAKPKDAAGRLLRQVRRRPRSSPTPLPFTSKPVSKCSELYPVYSNVATRSRRSARRQHPQVPAEAGGREGLQGRRSRRRSWRASRRSSPAACATGRSPASTRCPSSPGRRSGRRRRTSSSISPRHTRARSSAPPW